MTEVTDPRANRLRLVYAIGLLQGLALVAVPASATILQGPDYGLTPSQYGALFVPQCVLAIVASLTFPRAAARVGPARLLVVGLGADLLAMALLTASQAVAGDPVAHVILLAATSCLGFGFGTTLSCLSTFAGAADPQHREVALTTLNVFLGLGTALSPLLIALFGDHGEWWYLPVLVAVGVGVLAGRSLARPLADPSEQPEADGERATGAGRGFLVFAVVLVIYGIDETMFGNWGTTLLTDAGTASSTASYALAAFWAAVTAGRLAIAVVGGRVPTTTVYRVLPFAVAIVLIATAGAGADAPVLLFALGGLACSGIFPMSIGFAEGLAPGGAARAAGWSVAAYQVGYGIAAFGAGTAERRVGLPDLFRVAGGLAVIMGLGTAVIARVVKTAPSDKGGQQVTSE